MESERKGTAMTEPQAAHEAEFAQAMSSAMSMLVSEFDFLDLAYQLTQSTVSLLDAQAAGAMLEDRTGRLQVVSASDEDTRVLELFELQREQGPCYECWRTGKIVVETDIAAGGRWPDFLREARALGFTSAVAVPLRLRGRVVGALNVFWRSQTEPAAWDLAAAQALADVAVVGLVQQQLTADSHVLAEQLERALQSRVIIEQAKGVIAVKGDMTVADAFTALRDYADRTHQSLVAVSRGVVDRTLEWHDSSLRAR